MVFTEETGDGIYIGDRRLYLHRKQEMVIWRKQEMAFTVDT